MRLTNLMLSLFLIILLGSCIREEAPNAEADILTCTLPGDVMAYDTDINNETDIITLYVKEGTDITALAPEFIITSGATINPGSGTVFDFTTPRIYEVTSEDRQWKRMYTVTVVVRGANPDPNPHNTILYHFENMKLDKTKKFQIFYEIDELGNEINWASGNVGFSLTGVQATPTQFPTSQADEGVSGKCLRLETKETGDFGSMLKMPIAAGNLFLGTFTIKLSNVLEATKFGTPFFYVPTTLKGYYKYKRGETFQVNGEPVPGRKDICDIYGVFYETDENLKTLDGTNVLAEDNPNIISVARIDNAKETDEWTEFNLKFNFREGKTVDPVKLKAGRYNMAIVFSSSIRGDHFEGAPGSLLYIDEVELGYE